MQEKIVNTSQLSANNNKTAPDDVLTINQSKNQSQTSKSRQIGSPVRFYNEGNAEHSPLDAENRSMRTPFKSIRNVNDAVIPMNSVQVTQTRSLKNTIIYSNESIQISQKSNTMNNSLSNANEIGKTSLLVRANSIRRSICNENSQKELLEECMSEAVVADIYSPGTSQLLVI